LTYTVYKGKGLGFSGNIPSALGNIVVAELRFWLTGYLNRCKT